MSTTAAISLDRFRLRRRAAAPAAADTSAASHEHTMVGMQLGTIERRYGLMCSEETITISAVIATSGDLAVADRLAFIAAIEQRVPVLVVEFDDWYVACTTERTLAPGEITDLRSTDGAPRVMSVASERGITPALGPLTA